MNNLDVNLLIKQISQLENNDSADLVKYKSDNVLFHYTRLDTCLEKILPSMKLKMSHISQTSDPFDACYCYPSVSNYYPATIDNCKKLEEKGRKNKKEIENLINNVYFISLCKNNDSSKGLDYFGFSKPRMWAQYANNFSGICLAIDKTKLLTNNGISSKNNYLYGDVQYNLIEEMNSLDINLKNPAYMTKDKIHEVARLMFPKIYFSKHKDFRDENEFRIIKYFSNDTPFIDISNALIGVILGTNYKFYYETLKLYSKKYNFSIRYIEYFNKTLEVPFAQNV